MMADSFAGPIERWMTEGHARIGALLERVDREGGIDAAAFDAFRRALLHHIALEEKVLLPYACDRRFGDPWPVAAQLEADHVAIAKLLASGASPAACVRMRQLLRLHNALEEGPSGLYAACDGLAGRDAEAIVERLRRFIEPDATVRDGSRRREAATKLSHPS
jgi:hypothetical protein